MLTLILGGARSGKSRLAQRLAATAESRHLYRDSAGRTKIRRWRRAFERHRARPARLLANHRRTIGIGGRGGARGERRRRGSRRLPDDLAQQSVLGASGRPRRDRWKTLRALSFSGSPPRPASCHVILVSNELGCGTVPESAVTRAFRDAQGLLNQWAAEAADEVILTVAGLPLYLKTK